MNLFRGVVLTLVMLLLGAASANDELTAAWNQYADAYHNLNTSFASIDDSWSQVTGNWDTINSAWVQVDNSWAVVERNWTDVEANRIQYTNATSITLYDSTPRITRWSHPRAIFQTYQRSYWTPWAPEASYGSWDALAHAWSLLDAAWASSDAAWVELNNAWAELGRAGEEVANSWTYINQAFQQTSAAMDEVSYAWSTKSGSQPMMSIVEIAQSDSQFSTLVAAVVKTDLVGALNGAGPLTVFAPTNSAFAALAHSLNLEVADLLELPNLKDILLYHVASGRLTGADIIASGSVSTLQGNSIGAHVVNGNLVLNSSINVIAADIAASNGIIHVIDAVLLP